MIRIRIWFNEYCWEEDKEPDADIVIENRTKISNRVLHELMEYIDANMYGEDDGGGLDRIEDEAIKCLKQKKYKVRTRKFHGFDRNKQPKYERFNLPPEQNISLMLMERGKAIGDA